MDRIVLVLLIILFFIIITIIALSIQHIWFHTKKEKKDKDEIIVESKEKPKTTIKEKYCKMDKLLCNNGNCFPGVQKRCNKFADSKCEESLVLCNYLEEEQCNDEDTRIFCKYDNDKCVNRINPHMGVQISKEEYDNKIELGWTNNIMGCDEQLFDI
jgi:hypothetical protein